MVSPTPSDNPNNPGKNRASSAKTRPFDAPLLAEAADTSLRRLIHELAGLIDGAARYLGLATREMADHASDQIVGPHVQAAALAVDQASQLIRTASNPLESGSRMLLATGQAPGDNLADVIRHACLVLAPLAEELGVELSPRLSPDIELVAPIPLYAVVSNGLRNAIEASPRGAQVDVVALVSHEREDPTLVIDVLDAGDGPPEQISRVCEPGFSTKPEGAGLGLAIARDILRSLDGSIVLEHRPAARGAKLSIRVPLRPEHLLPPAEA